MTFTVTRSGTMRLNTDAMIRVLEVEAVARIQRRTSRGVDINDRAFAGYSARYIKALVAGGEGVSVDLTLTGGLLKSVHVIETVPRGNVTTIVIAPGTGSSPAVSLTDGVARRTGKRTETHNAIGYWLHFGTPTMRARPWLALSPSDRQGMRDVLYRASVLLGAR